MKKFGKFLFGTVSLATLACGAYYVYKNLINKDSSDEFDEFEDEFEDFDDEDEDAPEVEKKILVNMCPSILPLTKLLPPNRKKNNKA